jgi:hypothetical protein
LTKEEKEAAIKAAMEKRTKVQNVDGKTNEHAKLLKAEKEKRGAKKEKVHGNESTMY